MRTPLRVVVDYDVDRAQVQVQRCTQPSATNSPNACAARASLPSACWSVGLKRHREAAFTCGPCMFARIRCSVGERRCCLLFFVLVHVDVTRSHNSGGYSCGAPPLPIPNREVKPARADGTAPQSGRVGRRRLREGLPAGSPVGRFLFLLYCPWE